MGLQSYEIKMYFANIDSEGGKCRARAKVEPPCGYAEP